MKQSVQHISKTSAFKLALRLFRDGKTQDAIKLLDSWLAKEAGHPEASFLRQRIYLTTLETDDNLEPAIRELEALARKLQQVPVALAATARAWLEANFIDEAIRVAKEALTLCEEEEKLELLQVLARAYLMNEQFRAARTVIETGLEKAPENSAMLMLAGLLNLQTNRFGQAHEFFSKLTELEPENVFGLMRLTASQLHLQQYEEVLETSSKVLQLHPNAPQPHAQRATALSHLGRKDEAWSEIEPLLKTHPEAMPVANAFGTLASGTERAEEARDRLRQMLDRALAKSDDRRASFTSELHTLAGLEGELGNYAEAIELLAQAKQATDDISNHAGFISLVKNLRDAADFVAKSKFPNPNLPDPQPVLVVGLPRSGTTLTEQILGNHPVALPLGELPFLSMGIRQYEQQSLAAKGPAYPQFLPHLDQPAIQEFATNYHTVSLASKSAQESAKKSANCRFFLDKLPYNYLHIPMFLTLFPQSKVIYCRRNPLDNLLSCYFLNFQAQFSFMFNLHDLGFLYRWHDWLMQHYLQVFADRVLEVRYERMVADPEKEASRALEWLGLDWDPACLEYHQQARLLRTASWDQANRPVYRSSVGRFLPYLEYLQPTLAVLGQRLAADHLIFEQESDTPQLRTAEVTAPQHPPEGYDLPTE